MTDGNRFFEECGHVQLSREQASHFYDIEAWRLLSPAERCGFQVHQECLTMPFGTFRNDFELILEERMADIAFQKPYFLAHCLKSLGIAVPEVEEVVSRIPEGRRGPLADLLPLSPQP